MPQSVRDSDALNRQKVTRRPGVDRIRFRQGVLPSGLRGMKRPSTTSAPKADRPPHPNGLARRWILRRNRSGTQPGRRRFEATRVLARCNGPQDGPASRLVRRHSEGLLGAHLVPGNGRVQPPMTDPQAGKRPSSGMNRPVPGIRATGDGPGTLIPLAGRLQYQGRYFGIGESKFLL